MLKKISLILSVILLSLNIFNFGLFYGFHYGSLLQGVTYTIGNMTLSGPGPYEDAIVLQRIISFFSIVAFGGVLSEKRMLSKVLCLFSLLVIVTLYIVSYLSKARYITDTNSYFDFMRETLSMDIIGLVVALLLGGLTIYSMIYKTDNTKT